jgi:hypothetical protein
MGLLEPTQVHRTPWDTARFPNRRALDSTGARHGRCNLRAGPYAPAVVRGIELWSPALEHFGRRVIPWIGAFQALTIQLPATEAGNITKGGPARSPLASGKAFFEQQVIRRWL